MKKIAIFWSKRFNNNNFYNIELDSNLQPYYKLAEINNFNNTISYDLLDAKKDKNNYIILCFLTLSFVNLIYYIKLFIKYPKNKKYFFIFEPRVWAPLNYCKILHVFFHRVYTRNDDLVDNKKYFKYIYPSTNNWLNYIKKISNKKLITLINWNKSSFGKNELYSEREKTIRYFEENSIEFDLYWTNWNKKNIKQKIFWFKKYTSYKWRVDDKIETLSNYKFNICFENMKNTPWYITEKIWDSFKAKSVPVYWWASNIGEYIPNNCFIDFRIFNWDYKKLLDFINNINEKEYNKYISNIEEFLKTEKAQKWFDEKWANNFLNNLK